MSSPPLNTYHVIRTDAGLGALWQPEGFSDISSLEEWEDKVSRNESIEQNIRNGIFVPLNVGGDGSWQVAIRNGGLSGRENKFLLVASEAYLLKSRGTVELGGLENVGGYVGGGIKIPLSPGAYTVQVNLIEWDAEPGSSDADGMPTESALPDFVILISHAPKEAVRYRTSVETFERPADG
ncbi:hypothetical protein [Actinoplanes sp. NBRC 101535]|uniref:hypothetical protein n=1 Tax=Actinoplanes sp. NBRC 101535 TaxID=3032196 RepID=UPI0024A05D61|nr:hypothetical protein [Actinoplanes sp. NBRC 101535]GLY07873.1 hypothetical protein Acsp01_82520 [Actinoplanes sp. NBRC 101535]